MRNLILQELDSIKKEQQGFSRSNGRWQRFYLRPGDKFETWDIPEKHEKKIHVSEAEYHKYDDLSLFKFYNMVIIRYYRQM